MRVRILLHVEHLKPGKWTVRDAMPMDGLKVLFITVAAKSKYGVPDRSVGDIFPIERPVPVSGMFSYASLQLGFSYVREMA